MASLSQRVIALLSSMRLSCALLLLLGLLTWLGTLEQAEHGLYEVQRKYFESYFLVHDVGGLSIPLPGGNLVLSVLFLNLFVGGIARLRKGSRNVGVLVAHVGVALLLVSGFMKLHFSEEGHVTLFEDGRANTYQSYHRWEIAVYRRLPDGSAEEHLIPQESFAAALASDGVDERLVFDDPRLPFELELSQVFANCQRRPKGPMFEVDVPVIDGEYLQEGRRVPDAEMNVAGAYVGLVAKDGGGRRNGLLWGRDPFPLRHAAAGATWNVHLRKERYPMPFTLVLDDFQKEDHPRTGMPKSFSSDVTVVEGGVARPVRISMNEPLRADGLVVYQSGWGPQDALPGSPLFSTLAVVRNPADKYPLYACLLIAAGLTLHFSRKLIGYVRAESARAGAQ